MLPGYNALLDHIAWNAILTLTLLKNTTLRYCRRTSCTSRGGTLAHVVIPVPGQMHLKTVVIQVLLLASTTTSSSTSSTGSLHNVGLVETVRRLAPCFRARLDLQERVFSRRALERGRRLERLPGVHRRKQRRDGVAHLGAGGSALRGFLREGCPDVCDG